MKRIITVIGGFIFFLVLQSCGDNTPDGPENVGDNFDRSSLLADLADNVILPGYEQYTMDVMTLNEAAQSFAENIDSDHLNQLKVAFKNAYMTWQNVSMVEIGKAETISLRNYTNIYPTHTTEIENNIASGSYNLALPSKMDEQGFPAIDYLLFGTADTEEGVIDYFLNNENAKIYLLDITQRLSTMAEEVRDDWRGDYRATFIANDGYSATSSLNKVINDYLFYYEKFLRAGKIGIPAGVFSGNELPNNVEGLYSEDDSKDYFLAALNAARNFFSGISKYNDESGESIKSYLDYLDKDGNELSTKILAQFDEILNVSANLNDNFKYQIEVDNIEMLKVYDELQKNVILMKVDMMQTLNVKVDFVDADGD